MESLLELDTNLFRWINGHHCTCADWLLWTASQAWSWAIAIIAIWFYLTYINRENASVSSTPDKSLSTRNLCWFILTGVALCFLFSDRISVMCFKDVFHRLRPCHALDDVRMFHTSCGGKYGFVSSHAANVFALATFFVMTRKNMATQNDNRLFFSILMFAWACLVGYSRPYLGKHYPGDVVCGAMVGVMVGWLVYWIMSKIAAHVSSKRGR